jgi:hypothetical protein
MPSSVTLRRVALVISDVSVERIASIIRATRITELGTTVHSYLYVNLESHRIHLEVYLECGVSGCGFPVVVGRG